MAVPHASPGPWLGAEEAPPFGTRRLGSYFQCRACPEPRCQGQHTDTVIQNPWFQNETLRNESETVPF